jgi:hypothetical protein
MPADESVTRKGGLPDLIIIGAGKSGTTSLHYYLDLHPAITMTREKELHFFSKPLVWERGIDWYSSMFDGGAELRGEASVTYTAWPKWKGVPGRMASVVPDARLLYIVRDPVRRIVSSWQHRYADGTESRTLADALRELKGNDLVERSRYFRQIAEYLPFYPRSRIHVICSETLLADRRATLAGVFRFLGVDPAFDLPGFDRLEHESRRRRRKGRLARVLQRFGESRPARILSPSVRRRIGYLVYRPITRPMEPPALDERTAARLREFLAHDVARLRAFTGLPFAQWSI